MAKIRTAPTPEEFATTWSQGLGDAARSVARRGRVTRAQAERIGEDRPALRMYRDNVLNFLDLRDANSVSLNVLVDSGYRYALAEGERVKGRNNKISLNEAQGMALDLRDDFRILRGRAPLPSDPEPNLPSTAATTAALEGPVNNLSDWHDSGDNGVNVSVHALPGIESIEDAMALLRGQEPWFAAEAHAELEPLRGPQAVAAFCATARADLEAFFEEPRREPAEFAQAVTDIFARLDDARLVTGQDLGGTFLFGRTADGWTLVASQPYRDG